MDVLKDKEGAMGEAMRYATVGGGKRVRPLCVYLGAKAVGGNVDLEEILPIATAIELVHSYSLVHDDMPEMDNDDERRGKPSVHKKFGVATALLTGDALLSLAFVKLSESANARAMREIATSALDMVFGQSREFEGCDGEAEWLEMYAKKTGALILGAFRAGAICAGADEKQLGAVSEFASRVGLCFQLKDDLLDGDPSIVGAIGEGRVKQLLDTKSREAREIAGSLSYCDELISFADILQNRKV